MSKHCKKEDLTFIFDYLYKLLKTLKNLKPI